MKAVARANKICCTEEVKKNGNGIENYQHKKIEATNKRIDEYLDITKKDILDSLILQYVKFRGLYPQVFENFQSLLKKLQFNLLSSKRYSSVLDIKNRETTLDENIEKLDKIKNLSEEQLKISNRRTKEYIKPQFICNSREVEIMQNQLKKIHKEQQDDV